MELTIILSILSSFFIALLILPIWIRKCKKIGLTWKDMNKHNKPEVASSGGIVVIMAFVLSVLSYIAIKTFVFGGDGVNTKIFALLSVILILAIMGLTDDLLGWKHGGLSKRARLILAAMASIPLVVINAGVHSMNVPLLGVIDFGVLYPLLLIPLGIVGASTTYNFLAGFNGLEAGQGILILSFLSYVAYISQSSWLALVGLCMVAALLAFYLFNKFPAKVFPGDILTYSIGAMIAGMAILGNFEKIAVFVFIPYIAETFLKLRGGLKKQSFGKPKKDNSLKLPYKKIYGLTHLSIMLLSKFKKKVYERDVAYCIFIFQIIVIILAYLIFVQ